MKNIPSKISVFIEAFLTGNQWYWRFARTVLQAILSILITYLTDIVALLGVEDESLNAIVVSLLMAILSPIMSALGDTVAGANAKAAIKDGGDK